MIAYITFGVGLFVFFLLTRSVELVGNQQIHTLMELLATTLALFVGVLALIRFYTKRNNTFLLIGAGFIGTAFLDGYHAVVTSTFFEISSFPALEVLIPWSWNASRYFLALLMFVSWFVWRREKKVGKKGVISEHVVYAGITLVTLASFIFFAFYPLPRAYYPELFFGRPQELGAALLFLAALVGYLSKGKWKTSNFENWIILSLIAGFAAQTIFISLSVQLFDFSFDVAHGLKIISYLFALIALLVSVYHLSQDAERGKKELEEKNEELILSKRQAELDAKTAENSRKETEQINKSMVGRELKMIELKKELEELKKHR